MSAWIREAMQKKKNILWRMRKTERVTWISIFFSVLPDVQLSINRQRIFHWSKVYYDKSLKDISTINNCKNQYGNLKHSPFSFWSTQFTNWIVSGLNLLDFVLSLQLGFTSDILSNTLLVEAQLSGWKQNPDKKKFYDKLSHA